MTSRETAFAHRRPRRRTFLTWIVFLLFFSSTRMVVMGHTSTVDSTSTLTSTAMQHPWSARDRNGRTITLSRKRVVSTIRGGAGNSRNLSNPFTSASTSTRTPHTPSSSSTTPLFSNSRFATNNKREDDDQTKAPESTTTTKEMLDAFLTRDSRNSFIGRDLFQVESVGCDCRSWTLGLSHSFSLLSLLPPFSSCLCHFISSTDCHGHFRRHFWHQAISFGVDATSHS